MVVAAMVWYNTCDLQLTARYGMVHTVADNHQRATETTGVGANYHTVGREKKNHQRRGGDDG